MAGMAPSPRTRSSTRSSLSGQGVPGQQIELGPNDCLDPSTSQSFLRKAEQARLRAWRSALSRHDGAAANSCALTVARQHARIFRRPCLGRRSRNSVGVGEKIVQPMQFLTNRSELIADLSQRLQRHQRRCVVLHVDLRTPREWPEHRARCAAGSVAPGAT